MAEASDLDRNSTQRSSKQDQVSIRLLNRNLVFARGGCVAYLEPLFRMQAYAEAVFKDQINHRRYHRRAKAAVAPIPFWTLAKDLVFCANHA